MRVTGWFRAQAAKRRTVQQDWLARLPEDKRQLFEGTVNDLETHYIMLSVALNEALGMRAQGALVRAREEAAVSADLARLFAGRLLAALRALEEYGRHFADLPMVTPLKAEHFRGTAAQLAASWSHLFYHALLSGRLRFFHKLGALSRIVQDLVQKYSETAEEIATGISTDPLRDWTLLDHFHYDLNTCLRETIVLLKSFLCALPAKEVRAFEVRLCEFTAQSAPRGQYSRASA